MTLPAELLKKAYALIQESLVNLSRILTRLIGSLQLSSDLPLTLQLSNLAHSTLEAIRRIQTASIVRIWSLRLLNRTALRRPTRTQAWTTPGPSPPLQPAEIEQGITGEFTQEPLSPVEAIARMLFPNTPIPVTTHVPAFTSETMKRQVTATQVPSGPLAQPSSHARGSHPQKPESETVAKWFQRQEERGLRPALSHEEAHQLHQELYTEHVSTGKMTPDSFSDLFLNLPASMNYSEARMDLQSKLSVSSSPTAGATKAYPTTPHASLPTASLLLPSFAAMSATNLGLRPFQAAYTPRPTGLTRVPPEEPAKSLLSPSTRISTSLISGLPSSRHSPGESSEPFVSTALKTERLHRPALKDEPVSQRRLTHEEPRRTIKKDSTREFPDTTTYGSKVTSPLNAPALGETEQGVESLEPSLRRSPIQPRLSTIEALRNTLLSYAPSSRLLATGQPSSFRHPRGETSLESASSSISETSRILQAQTATETEETEIPAAEYPERVGRRPALPTVARLASPRAESASEPSRRARFLQPLTLQVPPPAVSFRSTFLEPPELARSIVKLPSQRRIESEGLELKPPPIVMEEESTAPPAIQEAASEIDKEAEAREQAKRLGRLLAEEARRYLGSD